MLSHSVPAQPDVQFTLHLDLRGSPYVLTVTRESFRLVRKGRRKGIELPWTAFLDEDAAMMSALHASMRQRSRSDD